MSAGFRGSSNGISDHVLMQLNRIGTTALIGGIIIGAGSTGYAIALATSYSGHYSAGQYGAGQYGANQYSGYTGPAGTGTGTGGGAAADPPAGGSADGAPSAGSSPAAGSSPMTGPSPMGGPSSMGGQGDATGYTNPSLAKFIAQKAGTRLAGQAPQSVPVGQVKGLSEQVPAGASIDARSDTITFTGTTVSFTVVAIAPDAPDMTFRVAGLTDPTIVVPAQARVTVRFINNDTDEAHGWLVTSNQPPFTFGQPAVPAIAGASAGVIGDPVSGDDGASTINFTAGSTGSYQYICPMPGHAQMGMHGSFIVR
jgi:rusticyanin